MLAPAMSTLHRMAGTTENEFLQIGSEVQGFYQRSAEIAQISNRLIEIVSGDSCQSLTARLHQMITEMEEYLASARKRSGDSCQTLKQVQDLLENLSAPLGSFQKMNKTLRMLSISTKIESSRLGELGTGFVNLAMDVEKLSHQVNDKSVAIMSHRELLAKMITSNLEGVRSNESRQDSQVQFSLNNASESLRELVSVNERCTDFAAKVSAISSEVTGCISEAVSSMQMHDMTRQQVEHIMEALEHLSDDLPASCSGSIDEERRKSLIVETGDVCELQEAQLRFSSSELYSAVCGIMGNLRDVASRQQTMAYETQSVTGTTNSTGSSFVDVMSQGMNTITSVLASCAEADRIMSDTMRKVARTIGEIATFVTDIEEIGAEIDLIALNAQVKAAHTGREGAALGVLAEAIKRLSDEAVRQTDSVASILNSIKTVTEHLSGDTSGDDEQTGILVSNMQEELDVILRTLGDMNSELFAVLSDLGRRVASLTEDVESVTEGIDVHERTKSMAAEVISGLERIVFQARQMEPASNEFKQNLQHMEQRYTMESERHIHEALARKRSGLSALAAPLATGASAPDDSEFGDNVDLF
ncbi:MAG: methyl-accepting chemotaxis protein [Geobacter sp.]|nr:methyl-accepting chemotaxis protein [Geobacter sp.]